MIFNKTTGRYVAGTMIGIFFYEVLDATGLVDKAVKTVTRTLNLR